MTLHLNNSCTSGTGSNHVADHHKTREKDYQNLSPSLNKFSFALSSGVTPVESESGLLGTGSRRIPNLSMDSAKVTPMESAHLESTYGTCNTFLSTVNSLSASDVSSRHEYEDEQADELNRPITSPNNGSPSPIHLRAETLSPNVMAPLGNSPKESNVTSAAVQYEAGTPFLDIAYPPMPVMANKSGSMATRFAWNGSGETSSLSPSSHAIEPPVDLPSLLAFQEPEMPSFVGQSMTTTHQHTITRRIENTIIKNAIIHRCSVKNCHVTNCQITDSRCEGGFFGTCKMVNTKLKNIPLITSSLLDRCLVKGVRMTNTIMRQGAVKSCRIVDSNLKQVGAYYCRLTRTHLIQCEYDFDEQLDCTFDDCRREGDPEQYFGPKNAKEMRINVAPKQGHQQHKNLAEVLESIKTEQQQQSLHHHHGHQHTHTQQQQQIHHQSSAANTVPVVVPKTAVGNDERDSHVPKQQKVRSSGCCSVQ